jgi:hypothetical protein
MFGIGDRVVCVDSSKQPHTAEELTTDVPNWVVKDKQYTIRAISHHDFGAIGVLLEEVVNQPKYFKLVGKVMEPMFAEWRFRRLEESKLLSKYEILVKDTM